MADSSTDASRCCGCACRNRAVLVLTVFLAVATTGWVMTAMREHALTPSDPTTPAETVEILVAAKDLSVGTLITKANLPKLILKKTVAKDALPPAYIADEAELFDKRLLHAVLKDETFVPSLFGRGRTLELPDGMDLMSLPLPEGTEGVAGLITPGSHVDVLAMGRVEGKLVAFPLLLNLQVMSLDEQGFPSQTVCSFAVTQEQALILVTAKQSECHLEVVPRHPDRPLDPAYDMRKVLALLANIDKPSEQSEAPAPRAKYPGLVLPEGTELVSLTFNAAPAGGFVGPGSRVDAIATVREGTKLHAFPLVVDLLVVAVDMTFDPKNRPGSEVSTVSFAVDQKQALVLALAKQRGCQIELLLRTPNKAPDTSFDIAQVTKFLVELPSAGVPDVAPAPRFKGNGR